MNQISYLVYKMSEMCEKCRSVFPEAQEDILIYAVFDYI